MNKSNVTQFNVGDEVFGEIGYGGYAEYVCAPEKNIAHKPASVSFEDAAASPMARLTALQGLRQADLIIIGELLASKKIVPVIDKVYPLSETAQALRQFEEVHAQGKIIISMA